LSVAAPAVEAEAKRDLVAQAERASRGDGRELGAEARRWAELIWLGPGVPEDTAVIELRTRWNAPAGQHQHHLGARGLGRLVLDVDGR
jgi:hypothetical protein